MKIIKKDESKNCFLGNGHSDSFRWFIQSRKETDLYMYTALHPHIHQYPFSHLTNTGVDEKKKKKKKKKKKHPLIFIFYITDAINDISFQITINS